MMNKLDNTTTPLQLRLTSYQPGTSDFDDKPAFASLFYRTVPSTDLSLALCSD